MLEKQNDNRREVTIIDIDRLVPKDHLVRKIEKVMEYEWIYKMVEPYYCLNNGRPGTDPVVLIKMVLIQHLFGISSLRKTVKEIDVNIAYRWFLGYGFLDNIPHFATISYNFCNRFPPELYEEIFKRILNKAINNRMVDTSIIFIDGTHIKASANNKKRQKEQVAKTAKIYEEQLHAEINADREEHGKKPFNDDNNTPPEMKEVTVSTTDPDCGVFRKGEHKTEFAYEAHTACDKNGFIIGVEVTAGNVHDSIAFDAVYEKATAIISEAEIIAADSAYKTPWICKRILDDGRIPSMPYKRPMGKDGFYRPWEYKYDIVTDSVICPNGQAMKYSTTNRDGYREYKSNAKECVNCDWRTMCTTSKSCQKTVQRHLWAEYVEIAEDIRKTDLGKSSYILRSQTIKRVFADAKEKHAMRYTQHRGLPNVTNWVKLKFACMNLKKLSTWSWDIFDNLTFWLYFRFYTARTRISCF